MPVESTLERTCDKCGKPYMLNSIEIPRIVIRKKEIINDLQAKDNYANPDFCATCTLFFLNLFQTRTPLRFSIKNEQANNTYFSAEENRILRAIKKR